MTSLEQAVIFLLGETSRSTHNPAVQAAANLYVNQIVADAAKEPPAAPVPADAAKGAETKPDPAKVAPDPKADPTKTPAPNGK